jgi:hypothetical protein
MLNLIQYNRAEINDIDSGYLPGNLVQIYFLAKVFEDVPDDLI